MKTQKGNFANCKFRGLRELDYERVFQSTIHTQKIVHRAKHYLSDIIKLITLPLLLREVQYTLKYQDNAQIIFFKSQWSAGKRFDKIVNSIAECCKSYDLMYYEQEEDKKESLTFNFTRWIKCLFLYYPSWFFALNHVPFWERFYFMRHLVYLLLLEKQLQYISIEKYNLLVLFLDTVLIESYVRECFRQQGITTSTLQHGQFRAARGKETCLTDWSIELEDSGVDYFLAWNQFTVDEAHKTQNTTTNFIPLGIPSFIGQEPGKWINPDNNIFGVVLGHPINNDENVEMIQIANKIAKSTGYSYVLKYHPHFNGDEYDSIIDNSAYLSNVKKGIGMKDYANQVEFSVIGNTSVMIEMAFMGHPIVHYVKDPKKDIYNDVNGLIKVESSFVPSIDFLNQIAKFPKDILFDELCTITNVEESYKKFFSNYQ